MYNIINTLRSPSQTTNRHVVFCTNTFIYIYIESRNHARVSEAVCMRDECVPRRAQIRLRALSHVVVVECLLCLVSKRAGSRFTRDLHLNAQALGWRESRSVVFRARRLCVPVCACFLCCWGGRVRTNRKAWRQRWRSASACMHTAHTVRSQGYCCVCAMRASRQPSESVLCACVFTECVKDVLRVSVYVFYIYIHI